MCSAQAYPCPCCGYKTIKRETPGSYEICPICLWEDYSPDEPELYYLCTALLRIASEPQNCDNANIFGESETIIQLIASVLHLDKESWELTLQFLSWRMLSLPVDYEECPFFAMGILLVATMLYRSEAMGSLLRQLGEAVIAEEERIRGVLTEERFNQISPVFLWGLKSYHSYKKSRGFCTELKVDKWKKITQQVLINPPETHPREAAALLQDIGIRVVGSVIDKRD